MNEWDFDVFSVPYTDLLALAYHALIMHPAISAESSKFDLKKLWRYICEIASRYHLRPFHNFRHATDVLLGTAHIMRLVERDHAGTFKDSLMVAALLVSALVHDTDHPGVMNGYLVATQHPSATKLEKPNAVLENHHADVAIALLQRPECDFVAGLTQEERTRFVALIRENVLNTDVTTTMPRAKEFEAGTKVRRLSVSVASFEERASESDAMIETKEVMCMIIKVHLK